MTTHKLDAKGLRCPQPILKITALMPTINSGDVLEVRGRLLDIRGRCLHRGASA